MAGVDVAQQRVVEMERELWQSQCSGLVQRVAQLSAINEAMGVRITELEQQIEESKAGSTG